jgi:hypothetical protein
LPEIAHLEQRHPDLVVTFDDITPILAPDDPLLNSVVHNIPRGLELFDAMMGHG